MGEPPTPPLDAEDVGDTQEAEGEDEVERVLKGPMATREPSLSPYRSIPLDPVMALVNTCPPPPLGLSLHRTRPVLASRAQTPPLVVVTRSV